MQDRGPPSPPPDREGSRALQGVHPPALQGVDPPALHGLKPPAPHGLKPAALQGLDPAALAARVPALTAAESRRIVSALYRRGPEALAGHLPQVRREALAAARAAVHVPTLALRLRRRSAVDTFEKYLFEAADGAKIESVRIPLERPDRFSVCVSSQVGCGLGCAFCATGRLGLARNLEAWEIVEQVRQVRAHLPPATRVHGVVFQGMGEPLANLDRVLAALRVLRDPSALAIDGRAITICTAGLPSGIRRLAAEAPQVRLGISIASARAATRRRLMPIDGAHPLAEVLAAAVDHCRVTGLAPMLAVTLLRGHNDGEADALALAALVHEFRARAGVRPRVSIIPYNSIDAADDPFDRAPQAAEDAFRELLTRHGVPTHRRYSGGGDIDAACGQLAARG